jgi:hypothetical protein
MIRLSKSVLAVGGVIIAAGLITFTNPKTVHALAAALVQVTNTASNPVVTQGVVQQASQIIRLYCVGDELCIDISSMGTYSIYTVPANQYLVINSIDVVPDSTCSSRHVASLNTPIQFVDQFLLAANVSTHMTYPSGLVIQPGLTSYFYDTCQYDSFYLVGYLTPN